MRSPFNGLPWIVPPDVTPELYAELVKRGFVPMDADDEVKETREQRRK